VKDGQPIATVARSWVRMARSWELIRQETTMPARNYRDVVEVERRPPAGGRLRTPLPVFACIAKDSAARSQLDHLVDPFGAMDAPNARRDLLAPVAPRDIAECVADGYGDDCAAAREDVRGAEIELAGTIVAAAVACSVPQPLVAATCAAALSIYAKALGSYYVKQRALERCIAEQAAKQKACACAGGTAMESRAAAPASVAARMNVVPAPTGPVAYVDCSGYDPFADGGEGPSAGQLSFSVPTPTEEPASQGTGYRLCAYEVDYDLDTGRTDVYVLYCYTVNVT
jgi:hypothetical protein